MAIVVNLLFPGGSLDLYDAVMNEAGLLGAGIEQIPGARAHYAWSEGGDLHILDVYESQEAFESFFPTTIVPAAQRLGAELHPEIKISPLHNSIP